jgi:hypothetical protein
MGRKNLLKGSDQSGKGEDIEQTIERSDQKIDVEIREIIRVRPCDFEALKNSFESWAAQWD